MISFRESMKALWGMSAPVRWRMVVSLAVGLVRIAASLAFVWASKQLVDIATGQSSFPLWPAIWIFVGVLVLQVAELLPGKDAEHPAGATLRSCFKKPLGRP